MSKKNFARPDVQSMKAYVPPLEGRRSGESLLLDFNERTLAPSEKVIKALADFASNGSLQVYPEYGPVVEKLCGYLGVGRDKIMLSNGSDNAIDVAMRTFLEDGDTIVIPQPSFSMFVHSAKLQGAKIVSPAYTLEEGYPFQEVQAYLENNNVKMCVICNPNNPTGSVLAQDKVKQLVEKFSDVLFLIDEAYYEFLQETSLSLALSKSNILLTRTFSKAMGIPALRFGYMVADQELIGEMIKVRGPYAVNMMSVAAVIAALSDVSYVTEYADEVMKRAKPFIEDIYAKHQIPFWPSGCNFHLLVPPVEQFAEKLEQQGIKVRPMGYPGFEKHVRISVGTLTDEKKLAEAIAKILK